MVEQAEVRNFALTSLYNHLSILLIYMCSQSYGFSSSHVWMWKMDPKEGWAPKNWYFELWCWRRLLRVPWTARRSNQSILKKINPKYSLEGLMLRLKLQHFGHLIWRADYLEKTLILGKIRGKKRSGQQRVRWLDRITDLFCCQVMSDYLWHHGRQHTRLLWPTLSPRVYSNSCPLSW